MLIKKKLIRLETYSWDNWKTLQCALKERKIKMEGRMEGQKIQILISKFVYENVKIWADL